MHFFTHEIRLCGLIICFISFCALQLLWQVSLLEALIVFVVISSVLLLNLVLGQGIPYPLIRPSVWFGFGHFLFMVLGSVRFFAFVEPDGIVSEQDLLDSMTLVIAATLLFQVGYYFSSKTEATSNRVGMTGEQLFIPAPVVASSSLLPVLLILTATGFCAQIFNLIELNPALSLLNLANVLASILALVAYFELIASRRSSAQFRVLLVLIIAINFPVLTLVSSRYVYFYVVAVFSILFYHRIVVVLKRSISYISIALFGIVIYVLGSFTKTYSLSEGADAPASDAFLLRLITIDFLDAFDNFSRILVESRGSDAFDITPGSFLLHPFTNFIPRTFWQDKPRAFSVVLAEKWFPDIEGLSLASSLLGELIANFDVAIALGVYAILGVLCRPLDKVAMSRISNIGFVSVIAMSCYFLFMVSRGDFLLSVVFVYLLFGFVTIWRLI